MRAGAWSRATTGKAETHSDTPITSGTARLDRVNVLQDTASTSAFSRGNTLPIAALPFGLAHQTIASDNNTPWMFDPGSRRIEGFRCTHQLSPWLSDYSQVPFLPCTDDHDSHGGSVSSSWSPEKAQLHPYSFRLLLTRYRADAEIVPTERCAILTAHFEDLDNAAFRIAVPQTSDKIETDKVGRTIRFTSNFNQGGVPENFATYYVIRMSILPTVRSSTGSHSVCLAANRQLSKRITRAKRRSMSASCWWMANRILARSFRMSRLHAECESRSKCNRHRQAVASSRNASDETLQRLA